MSAQRALNIPAINNELEALAVYLEINTGSDAELARFGKLNEIDGVHFYRVENIVYMVAHTSRLKADKTVFFNSSSWSVRKVS
ncbi:MAG: hypothetical protein ACJAS1_003662 [Oleiphilaceae bacterium]|jgi:hypothetical protein